MWRLNVLLLINQCMQPRPGKTIKTTQHVIKFHLCSWQCSASCGDGIQRREVFCQVGDRRSPQESGCSERSRPPSSQTCRVGDCPARYRWREGDWQPVSGGDSWEAVCSCAARPWVNVLCHVKWLLLVRRPERGAEEGRAKGDEPRGQSQSMSLFPLSLSQKKKGARARLNITLWDFYI